MNEEIIDNFSAIRLLVNTYMIKKVKSVSKSVSQEKFIEDVYVGLTQRAFNYSTKCILFTWKYLLDNYQHYKQNFTAEEAKREWAYFQLMDNCFDNSRTTADKFADHKWIFHLLNSLKQHRHVVLHGELTMNVLEAVEDEFQKLGNYDINQKDIYNQWSLLKKVYKKLLGGTFKNNTNYSYLYSALKEFFEKDDEKVSQNELISAVDSILPDSTSTNNAKRRKLETTSGIAKHDLTSKCEGNSECNVFTADMHNVLLQSLRKNRKKLQKSNSKLDDEMVMEVSEDLKNIGYDVTKSLILNEWNDLSSRYELIKNSEQPEKWAYFSDIKYIYENEDDEYNTEDEGVGKIMKNSKKTSENNVQISEKLLNIYECNNKELLEIKDALMERNLLREETNYLLNNFVDKFNTKH